MPASTEPISIQSSSSSWWRSRLLEGVLFTLPAIFMGLLVHVRMLQRGDESTIGMWILDNLLVWYFWWAVLPFLRYLAAKWGGAGKITLRHICLHLLVAFPLALIHLAFSIYGSILIFGEDPGWEYFLNQYIPSVMRFLPLSMLIYTAIVGIIIGSRLRRKLSEEKARLVAMNEQAARAQLAALQGQINPHFLFNTLNSLDVLIRSGKPNDASTLLHQLADLLRSTLSVDSVPTHTLREELRIVDTYLKIETTRFADRLTIERKIDTLLLDRNLPVFALQTLVENAVRHGIAKKVTGGIIELTACDLDGELILSVADNGPGESAQLHRTNGHGVGLTNLRRRLVLLYGKKSQLTSTRNVNDFTIFRLNIPLESGTTH